MEIRIFTPVYSPQVPLWHKYESRYTIYGNTKRDSIVKPPRKPEVLRIKDLEHIAKILKGSDALVGNVHLQELVNYVENARIEAYKFGYQSKTTKELQMTTPAKECKHCKSKRMVHVRLDHDWGDGGDVSRINADEFYSDSDGEDRPDIEVDICLDCETNQ